MARSSSQDTMELLAPAGGWEQLEYAIHFGADAVYLASTRYGMRRRADNFDEDELPKVVAAFSWASLVLATFASACSILNSNHRRYCKP